MWKEGCLLKSVALIRVLGLGLAGARLGLPLSFHPR